VIVDLGAASGLIVPLIAVHLFVFYFGILADDTQPVGLAAFAAAAISGGDPIKTGIQGFTYDIRTAILPFMFIFNTQLLMIGIDNVFDFFLTIITAVLAMLAFAAATQGYFLVKNRIWETVVLVLVAFTLFRPGFWWDMVYEPIVSSDSTQIFEVAERSPPGADIQLSVTGVSIEGEEVSKVVVLPLGDAGPGADRLNNAGFEIRKEDGKVFIDNIVFGSAAEKAGLDFDLEISAILLAADRPPKQLMFIPAIILYLLVFMMQRPRRPRDPAPATA
jgi:hypothetical protein